MSEVLPEMASLGRSATDEPVEPGLSPVRPDIKTNL